MTNTQIRITGIVSVLLLIVAINSYCTQFVAGRLAYHPALGSPLFNQFYEPFAWWKWMVKFHDYAPTTYSYAFIIFAVGTLVALLIFRLVVGMKTRSSRKHDGTHGTAHFATFEEVKNTGLLNQNKGVYCGGYDNKETGRTQYLRHNGPEHICAIAPPRSGKGVGLIVPTLLSWLHSVFVLDIKGENYAMTAGWRQTRANNTVLRFDPAEPGVSCSWNPLGEIRFGTRYQISDAQNIALMVVDSDGTGIERNHFRSAAYELLVGLILHALYKGASVGRQPSIQDCAHMLTGVGDFASEETESEYQDQGEPKVLESLFLEMENVNYDLPGAPAIEARIVIQGVGRRMANTPARELGSIISTANNALSLYRDPIVGENTSRSDFKIADLMDADKPVSLYFITTPRNLNRMKPLMRLLLTQIVMGLTDRMEYDEGRSKTAHKHRLLLMLDEFPSLGKLEVFENALAYISGYGIKAYIITQDVQQLYKAYTNYESIISNCHVRIAFAPNKLETAEWLSKMTGISTVIKENVSTSGKRFGGAADHFSRSYQEVSRPLMTADEIMRLPGPVKDSSGNILEAGEMLVFVAGQSVIRGRQILYFLDPTFNERSRIAPPAAVSVRDTVTKGFAAG